MKIKKFSELNESKGIKYKMKVWDWKEDLDVVLKDISKQFGKWKYMTNLNETGGDDYVVFFSNEKISQKQAQKIWEDGFEE